MKHNMIAIRKLIIEAFDDEELVMFCDDHFAEVTERFGDGMGKSKKAHLLVTYCDRHEKLESLVGLLRVERPEKYAKYQAQLGGGKSSSATATDTTVSVSPDVYSVYEAGLRELLHQLGSGHPRHVDALVYQQRMFENIAQSRQHGDTDARKAERSQVINRLNQLALSVLGRSFNDLCGLG